MSYWLEGSPMDPAAIALEPLPLIPGIPILHAGCCAILVGPTGTGRSSLASAIAYDAALHGVRVAYLGSEITEPEFNARAGDLAKRRGDTIDDELRASLSLVRYLDLADTIRRAWADPAQWAEDVAALYDVVIPDPISAIGSTLDLDFDKSNADFVKFYDRLIQPITARGVAVLMPDNVGHAIEARARAKGASAKSDRADLTFSCALQSNPVGLLVTARKVRSVRAAFSRSDSWLFDRDTQTITAVDGDSDAGIDTGFRPTQYMDRVKKTLAQLPGLTKREIRTHVAGKAVWVDQAVDMLVADGLVSVEIDGRAHRHHLHNVSRVPTVSQRVPDTLEENVSRVPVRSRGHEDTYDVDTPDAPTRAHTRDTP